MSNSQEQRLEKKLISTPIIFVRNNAFAFFDVPNPPYEPINVAKIKDNPIKELYAQSYNLLVNENEACYFRIGEYKYDVETVSVTTPCIIFYAFISENGRLKSSGVYHYFPNVLTKKKETKKGLYKLIDTIRSKRKEEVIIKVAGNNKNEEYLQEFKKELKKILAKKGVKIEPEHLLLGGNYLHRITRCNHLTGQLITYTSNSLDCSPNDKTKTIL